MCSGGDILELFSFKKFQSTCLYNKYFVYIHIIYSVIAKLINTVFILPPY
jgi:hypothetical protein